MVFAKEIPDFIHRIVVERKGIIEEPMQSRPQVERWSYCLGPFLLNPVSKVGSPATAEARTDVYSSHHIGLPVNLECTISVGLLSALELLVSFMKRTCEAMQLYEKCLLCYLDDDWVRAGDLHTGLVRTISAWQAIYSEDYLNPSSNHHRRPHPNPCLKLSQIPIAQLKRGFPHLFNSHWLTGQCPQTKQVIKTPNYSTISHHRRQEPLPDLTPAHLDLWDLDVKHQKTHAQADYRLRECRSQPALHTNQIAALDSRLTSLMKRLTDSSKRKTLETNRTAVASNIKKGV